MPAPNSLNVSLPGNAAEALRLLARREFRHPRDQAALLLVEGLRRAGVLLNGDPDPLLSPESDQPQRAELADVGAAR